MRKVYFIAAFMLSAAAYCKDDYKYGKVTEAELLQKSFPQDSLAGAAILYSIGEVEAPFSVGHTIYTKREKIKIYDKNSLSLANQTLILYNGMYSSDGISIISIKGTTYNMVDGKIVETDLPKQSARIDKLDDYHDIVHFALTNVKEGSVIEYEIKLNGAGLVIPDWYFQQYFPVAYSQFSVNIPEFFKFRKYEKGHLFIPPPEESTELEVLASGYGQQINYSLNKSTWKMKDIPPFVPEPFILCNDDFIAQVNHELLSVKEQNFTTNWLEIVKRLSEDSYHGKILEAPSAFMDVEYNKVKNITDNVERMKGCFTAIQSKMSWNNVNSIFCRNMKSSYKESVGSSADINFMLLRLLKDCNIEAYPVVLSTRNNGFVPLFPTFRRFNYVIALAKINGQSYLLDATDKFLPAGMLPPRCLNGEGLIIKEGSVDWTKLTPQYSASTITSVEAHLMEDGSLKGKSTFKETNYSAFKVRNAKASNSASRKQSILKTAASGASIENYTITNSDSLQLPLIENFEFTIPAITDYHPSVILLDPILFEKISDNPFKNPVRKYPVEFETPIEKSYIVNIVLPEGLSVQEKPKNVSLNLADNSAKFTYQVTVINNTIQIIAKLNIKSIMYSQDQYPDLKEFYADFIAKLSEPVILQRK